MKKLVLSIVLILVVALCAIAFTACNNATTQGQLENVWLNYEQYVYEVKDTSGDAEVTGDYTTTIQLYQAGSSVDFGEGTLQNVRKGYLVSSVRNLGTTTLDIQCYFELVNGKNFLVPAATYRKYIAEGKETVMSGNYDGDTLNYTFKNDAGTQTGSIKVGSPYYDNNEFHQVLRGTSTMSTSFSFSFEVPVVAENEMTAAKLTAKVSAKEDVGTLYTPSGAESALTTPCYKMTISRTTKVAGSTQAVYYSVDDISVNGWALKHVITKVVEPTKTGNVTYTLKDINVVIAE